MGYIKNRGMGRTNICEVVAAYPHERETSMQKQREEGGVEVVAMG